MKARELTERAPVVTPKSSVHEAARLMRDARIPLLPVVDSAGSTLLGVIDDPYVDVRCASHHHPPTCAVGNHMSERPVHVVQVDDPTDDVLDWMTRSHVRCLPVVDEARNFVGIIKQSEIVRAEDLADAIRESQLIRL